MTKKGCTCLIYPKPLIEKRYTRGVVAFSEYSGGSPLIVTATVSKRYLPGKVRMAALQDFWVLF